MKSYSSSITALVLSGALGGLLAGCSHSGQVAPRATSTSRVSPSASPVPLSTPSRALVAALHKVLKSFDGRAGVKLGIVVDGTRAQARLRSDESFESASLVKLPILAEYFCQVSEGRIKPEQKMVFEERFRVGGSGSLKDQPSGSSFSLATLAEWMITRSDNVATDMLMEKLGASNIEARMKTMGLKHTTVRRRVFDFAAIERGQDNLTTPNDMALLLSGWREARWPLSREALQILEKQERKDIMTALLPPGLKVAHKTGQLTGFLHDVGIVSAPQGDYIVILMSQGGEGEAARQVLAQLSLEVFTLMSKSEPGGR